MTRRGLIRGAPGEWAASGLCRQVDPEMFFPGKSDTHVARDALRLCQECPVMLECREYAASARLQTPEAWYGIWGGLTARALGSKSAAQRVLHETQRALHAKRLATAHAP